MDDFNDNDRLFAYLVDSDNVLCELPVERYSPTSGTSAIDVIGGYCDAFGFRIFTVEREQWQSVDWDRGYAELEDAGMFTPERRAHLFDY